MLSPTESAANRAVPVLAPMMAATSHRGAHVPSDQVSGGTRRGRPFAGENMGCGFIFVLSVLPDASEPRSGALLWRRLGPFWMRSDSSVCADSLVQGVDK